MPIICKAAAISVVQNGQKLTKLYQHMPKMDQSGPKLANIGRFQLSEGGLGQTTLEVGRGAQQQK